ncbi:unnamed protein product [Closterium sp. NIES-53]
MADKHGYGVVGKCLPCLDLFITFSLTHLHATPCCPSRSAMADKHSYGVVRKFIGHGVGSVFHAGPAVLHYREFCRSPFPHPSPTLTPPFPHPDPTLTPLRPHSDPTLTPLRPHSDPTLTPPFHAEFSPLPFPHPDPTIPC